MGSLWAVWQRRVLGRRTPAAPVRVPLEVLASDARRLGTRLSSLPPGTSFCKVQAVSHAYERVLGACADALEIDHLLGVLGPGSLRDAERERLVRRLHLGGLELTP